MTLRTGTSKTGKVHKYYTCSTCMRQGKSACKGRSIAIEKLNTLVTQHLVDRLLDPERLAASLRRRWLNGLSGRRRSIGGLRPSKRKFWTLRRSSSGSTRRSRML
jgi:hypothetical protein